MFKLPSWFWGDKLNVFLHATFISSNCHSLNSSYYSWFFKVFICSLFGLKFSKWFWTKCNQNLENSFIYKINAVVKQIGFFFFFQFESSHCLWTDQVIKIIMVDTSVLPSNKAVDLIFPVANISIFYKMSDLSLYSTLWRR